jgi:hypothetical protein
MNKLIFLNGAVNCGKTTVGRRLLELCENIAFVELDSLHAFVPWMPIERAVSLTIKNGLAVAANFMQENIDVLFAYPLSDNDFAYVKSLITFYCTIECITLCCSIDKNITNRGSRELSSYEVDRIQWMHNNGLARPSFSRHVDTTSQTIDETANTVIELLQLKRKIPA